MKKRDYIEKYGYSPPDVERLREAKEDGLVAVEHDGHGIFCIWCHGLRGSVPEWDYIKDKTSKDIVFCKTCGKALVGVKKVGFSEQEKGSSEEKIEDIF